MLEACNHLTGGDLFALIMSVYLIGFIVGKVAPRKKKKQIVDFSRFRSTYYSQTGKHLHVTVSFDRMGHDVYLEDEKGQTHLDTVACSIPSLTEALDELEVNINYLLERGELFTKWGK